MKSFFAKILSWEGTKIISFTMAAVLALTGGGASGYYIYGAANSKNNVQEEAPKEEELPEEIPEEIVEEEPVEEEDEVFMSNRLYLRSSSVEKDLKITVVDDSGYAVSGIPFDVYIESYNEGEDADFLAELTRQEALRYDLFDEGITEGRVSVPLKGDKHSDDDEDGIIALEGISGGEYKIALGDVDGYDTSGALIIASVNETIEYKVVDVSSQIKKETQVNAAIEDTAKKNVADEGGMPDVSALLNNDNKGSESAVAIEVKKKHVSEELVAMLPGGSGASSSGTVTAKAVKTVSKSSPSQDTKPSDQTPPAPPAQNDPTPSDTTPSEPPDTKPSDTKPSDTTPTAPSDQTPSDTKPSDDPSSEPSTQPTPPADQGGGTDTTPSDGDSSNTPVVTSKLNLKRVGTSVDHESYEATVSMPESIKLYLGIEDSDASTEIKLSVSDSHGILDESEITWKSSDGSIIEISSQSDTSAKIKAKKKGSAEITVTIPYDDGDEGKTLSLKCKVKATEVDLDKTLTDKDGNILYLDEELTKEATLGDYEDYDVFYRRDNATVSVASGSVGVDVSKWNGSIDWGSVAKSGISFAIVRCGYRGSATGALIEDPNYGANIQGAKSAGLKVGIYMFTQAVNEAEAVEEASMAVSAARKYGINMPIYIDTEAAGGRADGLSTGDRTAIIKAFCKTVSSAGFAPGVYASKNWYMENLNASELSGYNIWVAQYAAACNYSGRYNMWQYTSKGSVPGMTGKVDMNIYY